MSASVKVRRHRHPLEVQAIKMDTFQCAPLPIPEAAAPLPHCDEAYLAVHLLDHVLHKVELDSSDALLQTGKQKKKSQGLRSGLYGGWGTRWKLVICSNRKVSTQVCGDALSSCSLKVKALLLRQIWGLFMRMHCLRSLRAALYTAPFTVPLQIHLVKSTPLWSKKQINITFLLLIGWHATCRRSVPGLDHTMFSTLDRGLCT